MTVTNTTKIRTAWRAILLLALCAFASGAWAQDRLSVIYDDGRTPEEVSSWQFRDEGDVYYLRANDVARLFKATQFWNASSRKVVLGVGPTRFVLTVDTRVVVVDGEPLMLRSPIRYDAGFVMIPLEFIIDIASHYTPRAFVWDEEEMSLRVEGSGYNVEGIDLASTANRTTATITMTEPLLYHMDTNTIGLVRLKLYGGRVEARPFTIRESHGLVDGVRAEQTERDAYIYFDIKKQTTRIRVDRNPSPHQLILILEKGALPDIPEPELAGRKIVEIVDENAAARRSLDVETVVIDAGHGGKDHGKTSPGGLLEKNVNLLIAKELRDRLERELNLKVVLTREDDQLLSLTRRSEIANEAGGDLFISIHCNSWFSERTGGFEAYFLSPARGESERALARYENAAGGTSPNGGGNSDSDIEFILWDLVQNEFINESSSFAELIQRGMEERLQIRNRGVKQANFMVLQGARMPAVLIETAFLSNPREEQLLADREFHRLVADGMIEAIRKFQARYR